MQCQALQRCSRSKQRKRTCWRSVSFWKPAGARGQILGLPTGTGSTAKPSWIYPHSSDPREEGSNPYYILKLKKRRILHLRLSITSVQLIGAPENYFNIWPFTKK
ncbi:hypothetical protein V8G54_011062 [Vigna mungo]|uniref:Uncharacterized protein n=1 Tax=Vigna mungo TaxID=3915 RepID=A0AAQ3NNX1_VIGMU